MLDLLSDRLALGDDFLEIATTDDLAKRRLRSLGESLANVRDREGRAVRIDDVPDDDRVDGDINLRPSATGRSATCVVLGHDRLSGDAHHLNLDVDLAA